MNRGAFSLFQWTLRRDVQLLRTHLVRGAFAGIMLLVLLMAWLRTLSVGAAGLNLFEAICWTNIIVSTLAGISYFSTCVTEESETGNLGLLKLAGMGAFSILLGKSTSRLVGAFMLLVVQFPFTLLAITLGGVTLMQILSAYAAIGAHLILVANLALCFSVFCQSSGRAAAWAAIVLILFFTSGSILGFARTAIPQGQVWGMFNTSEIIGGIERWQEFQLEMSVFDRITAVLSAAFAGPILTTQVWYSLLLAGGLFGFACLGFERSTRKQSTQHRTGLSTSRRSFRRVFGVSRTWKHALAWKEFNFLTGGHVMWVVRLGLFGGLSALVYQYGTGPKTTDWPLVSSAISSCVLAVVGCELLIYASRLLFDEARWGTFPLLLILPITARDLVWQKVWGCLLATLPAFGWLCVAIAVYPGELSELVQNTRAPIIAINFMLLLHVTVLLSLFMRWAALPAAVCVVFLLNSCCPVMSVGFVMGNTGGLALAAITVATYCILLLLPLQVEIISRVEDAANHEYGN